jgi:endoglucanase
VDDLVDLMHPALRILGIPTAPRHEQGVAAFVQNYLNRLKIPFRIDRYRNIVAHLRTSKARQPVAFGAHMDHPGFEVARIGKKQAECFFLGGVPERFFVRGTGVELFDGRGTWKAEARIIQILQWRPSDNDPRKHVRASSVLKWKPGFKRILLNIVKGDASGTEFGMWKLPVLKLTKTHVVNRACDDLGGCAAILGMLELLVRSRASVNVYGVFTQREEIEFKAVFEVARSGLLPKSVPVVSVETSKALSNAPQGDGPIVRVGDKASIFDPKLSGQLCLVGKKFQRKGKFPFQRKLMDGGTCEATAYIQAGYVASGMCVALGNYHNCGDKGRIAAENIRLDDWNGLVTFMAGVAKHLKI